MASCVPDDIKEKSYISACEKRCLLTEFSARNNKFTAKVCCLCDRMIKHNDEKWIDINEFQNDNVIKRFTEAQKQNPYNFNPNARNNPMTSLNRIYTQKVYKGDEYKFLNQFNLSPRSYGRSIEGYNKIMPRSTKKIKGTTNVLGSCSQCKNGMVRMLRNNSNCIPEHYIANGLTIGYPPKVLTDLNEVELAIVTLCPTSKHIFSIMAGAHRSIKGWHSMWENDIQYMHRVCNFMGDNITDNEVNLNHDGHNSNNSDDASTNLHQHLVEEISNEQIAVVFCGPFTKTQKAIALKKTAVDLDKIKKALLWLKKNNIHYQNIDIDNVKIQPRYIYCDTALDKKDTNVEQIFEMAAVFPDDSLEFTGINGSYNNSDEFKKILLNEKAKKVLIARPTTKPVKDYVKGNLMKAFPLQFPYGIGNLRANGEERKGIKHYKYLIELSSPFFHTPSFVLILYNMYEKANLVNKAFIKVSDENNQAFGEITEDELQKAIDRYLHNKTGDEKSDEFLTTLRAVTGGMSNSRNSNLGARQKMFSMITHFGLPCVIFTITPEDSMNCRIMTMAGGTKGYSKPPKLNNCTNKELLDMVKESGEQRIQYPGFCALDFENIIKITIEDIIGWDTKKNKNNEEKGLFGNVQGWFYAVEEQGRSTLHAHFLLFIDGWQNMLEGLRNNDITEKEKWKDGMLKYGNQIMTANFLSGEKFTCKCGAPISSFLKCDNQDLRNLRTKTGCTKFGGKAIVRCSICDKSFTSNDMAADIIDSKIFFNPDDEEENDHNTFQNNALWFQSSVSSKRRSLMELAIMTELNLQQEQDIIPKPGTDRYRNMKLINTALRNLHNCDHCNKCFHGHKECRMKIPNKQCENDYLFFEDQKTNWYTWNGEKKDIHLFVREQQRTHEDSFVNVHNEYASMAFGCNTNVIYGVDGGSIIYLTKYVSKCTIDDDKIFFTEAAQKMIKRLNEKKIANTTDDDLMSKSNSTETEAPSTNDENDDSSNDSLLLGIRTVIVSALHATKNHYCAAPMAAYLIKNGSRFHSSHSFDYVNLKNYLRNHDNSMDCVDSIDHTFDGKPFFRSKTADYMLRSQAMNKVCLYDYISKYKVSKRNHKDKDGQGFQSSHPARKKMKITERRYETIPVVSHYDFHNTCLYNGKTINMNNIDQVSNKELHAMEENAKTASLLFIPFINNIEKLQDQNGKFLFRFRDSIGVNSDAHKKQNIYQIKPEHLEKLKNIQDCKNSNNAGRPIDMLERITTTTAGLILDNDIDDDNFPNDPEIALNDDSHLFMDEFNSSTNATRDNQNRLLVYKNNIVHSDDNGKGILITPSSSQSSINLIYESQEEFINKNSVITNPSPESGLCTTHAQMVERKTGHQFIDDEGVQYTTHDRDILQYASLVFGSDDDQIQAFQIMVNAFFVECYERKINGLSIPRGHITRMSKVKRERGKLIGFLSGPGGSGKSRVILSVINYCKNFFKNQGLPFNRKTIIVCALTGTAAVSILGQTAHSALNLSFNLDSRNCSSDAWKKKIEEFEQTYMVIIDEISFASIEVIDEINRKLNFLRNATSKSLFGNIPIMFCGDFSQLPPVMGKSIISKTSYSLFYEKINVFVGLQANHRFKNDEIWGNILSTMRTKILDKNSLEVINKRVVCDKNNIQENNIPECAIYATSTNQQRADINQKIFLNFLQKGYAHECICIKAGDIKAFNSKTNSCDQEAKQYTKDIIHSTCTDANTKGGNKRYDPLLKLYKGRQMLINDNIDVDHCIANGTLCKFTGIVLKNGIQLNSCKEQIMIENHEVNCIDSAFIKHIVVTLEDDNLCYIEPKKTTVTVDYMHNLQNPSESLNSRKTSKGNKMRWKRKFSMLLFPLNIANAMTVHKLQGRSIKNLVITAWSDTENFNYVSLSRCQTLNGLFLKKSLQKTSCMSQECKQFYLDMEKRKIKENDFVY